MPSIKVILLALLGFVAIGYGLLWAILSSRRQEWARPDAYLLFVGFMTNFFDTLGVGSFATTTALYRLKGVVADEKLPGTLNVGHCLPTIVQAFVFVSIIEVDQLTLVLLIASGVVGAWFGAGVVNQLSKRVIQIGLGTALLVAAALLLARLMNWLPGGGAAIALTGPQLVLGMIGVMLFGGLMMIGVGAYAPIMILVSLLGMNPRTAFPIMMGSCAFLTPVGSSRFLLAGSFDSKAAMGLTLGGIPAVLIAALLIRELPLDVLRWVVLLVALYTAATLLRDAYRVKSTESIASSLAGFPKS